jgi:hydrogenase/urease accessory protein HupE
VASEYTALGFKHIWLGIDHLLFVAGLLLLAQRPRKILYAITGFTIAHSITLSMATLDMVRVPIALVEAMIALSVFFLAVEITRNNVESFSHRFPIVISFVFGLLHGFGFASVLGEFHLPEQEIVVGLLFFNLGVELGQIAFIAIVSLLFIAWKMLGRRMKGASSAPNFFPSGFTNLQVKVGSYVLGIPAGFWFIERTAQTLWT